MTTTQKIEKQGDNEAEKRKQISALIGTHVLDKLGKPTGFHWVQVRRLWENFCRVNVLVGNDIVSARVAHSYFMKVDGAGNIVGATPEITKLY